ncbi:MAG: M13 family metallopeptidase [Proteobacteria bacterium]|nr:M13 family metallopeptidase [Pseudomonadota bacterium]
MRGRLAALLLVVACTGKAVPLVTTTPAPSSPDAGSATSDASMSSPAPPPAGVKVSLADVGLEASSIDRSADACVDFYQLACGGWLASNSIPADQARWDRFSEIEEKTKVDLRTILEDAARSQEPSTKKIGDAFAACMDEGAIEANAMKAMKAVLDTTRGVKDARTWTTALVELHKLGVFVVFDVSAAADLKDSTTNVTYLDAGGLGLPDRDYYVLPEFADKLAAYRAHVGKMLLLAGADKLKADDVVAIEVALAGVTKTGVERRDVNAAYNPTELKALGKQARSIDWTAYWKAVGYAPSKKLVVGTPRFFGALDGWRAKFTPAQWSAYFTAHALDAFASALPKAFDEEAFALAKVLTGVEQQQERGKRCVDATTGMLGELVGKRYADQHFPPAARQAAEQLVDTIIAVTGEQLDQLAWMTPETRTHAHAKLAKLVRMVGFPDAWKTYDFDIKRDDFTGNALRAGAFETRRRLARSGKPVDRGEWQMNSFTVNAYYEPTANNTALPAGILLPPFFGPDRQIAANLGGIGMVIGHELTHGFDDQGALFDGDGNLVNWWSTADKAAFEAKAACVADQYATFEAAPKQYVNGKLTLGENIADLGGVKMAWNAYRTLRKAADQRYVADGYTEDQQFFLAVGQAWCSKARPAETQRRLTVDVHAPAKFRIYGALRNMPEFATAFGCAAGTPMRPARSCAVW